MLEARNITVNYGECDVVRDVTFVLPAGKILAILGANGAGKTTLLRALNSSLSVSSGEIFLDEKSLVNFSRSEIARRISVVAQENETKFPITVLEFVMSGRFAHGGIFGWEMPHDFAVVRDALASCDLVNFETRLMNQLSGGERQRVLFARALATEAKILLLDEPTANLDLAHQALLFRMLRKRCDSSDGKTLSAVVITHDLNLAAQFSDEILLLKRGDVLARGTPREVFRESNLREAFGVDVVLDTNPETKNLRITAIY